MAEHPNEGHEGHANAPHKEAGGPLSGAKNIISSVRKHPLMFEISLIIAVACIIGATLYLNDLQSKIYIEKAQIYAPIISLSPDAPGTMGRLYVEEGDTVANGQKLAEVGNQTITAKTAGVVVWVLNSPGQYVNPQTPVVKMIDPTAMRVVGRLEEDKGLSDVKPGQKVVFTVDAFGSKQYAGSVESVGLTSRESDIVFSISDKRQEKEFEVAALFDTASYTELKNGMSAKMWVYK